MQKPIVAHGQPAQDESIAPVLRRGGPEAPRADSTAPSSSTRTGSRSTRRSTSTCSAPPTGRSTRGLRAIDKRRGFRKPQRNVLAEGRGARSVPRRPVEPADRRRPGRACGRRAPRWRPAWPPRRPRRSRPPPAPSACASGAWHADLGREAGSPGRGKTTAAEFLQAGDLIEVRLLALDETAGTRRPCRSSRTPLRGRRAARHRQPAPARSARWSAACSFARSKFNRATQAYRQMGSGFKPIVYTAAIDRGFTPTSILLDAPVSYPPAPGQPPYSPQQLRRQVRGRRSRCGARSSSRATCPRCGRWTRSGRSTWWTTRGGSGSRGRWSRTSRWRSGPRRPACSRSTAAYSVFPNQGVLMKPFQILQGRGPRGQPARGEPAAAARRDPRRHGLRDDEPDARASCSAAPPRAAASLDWPLAGKTGHDQRLHRRVVHRLRPEHHGRRVGGPRRQEAARAGRDRRAWRRCRSGSTFMKAYIERRGDRQNPPAFQPPGNIVFVNVDRATGSPWRATRRAPSARPSSRGRSQGESGKSSFRKQSHVHGADEDRVASRQRQRAEALLRELHAHRVAPLGDQVHLHQRPGGVHVLDPRAELRVAARLQLDLQLVRPDVERGEPRLAARPAAARRTPSTRCRPCRARSGPGTGSRRRGSRRRTASPGARRPRPACPPARRGPGS